MVRVAAVAHEGHVVDHDDQLFPFGDGKVVTQWPSGNLVYRLLTKMLGSISETTYRSEETAAWEL